MGRRGPVDIDFTGPDRVRPYVLSRRILKMVVQMKKKQICNENSEFLDMKVNFGKT
jgi:hypothetical protein